MTTQPMALSFDEFALSSRADAQDRAFRIVLLPGELLRVPRKNRSLRVIAGSAWVSHHGQDHTLSAGDELPLHRSRHGALVSAEGQTLFLEIA